MHLLLLQPKYLPTASHPEYSRMLFVKYFSKLSGRTLPRQTKCSPLSNIFSSQAGSLSKQILSHLQKSFSRGVIGQKNLSRPPVRELPRLPRLCTVQGGQGSCACHQRTKPGDDDHDNEHDNEIKAGSWDRMVGMIKTEIVLESQHGEDGKDSDEVLMRI